MTSPYTLRINPNGTFYLRWWNHHLAMFTLDEARQLVGKPVMTVVDDGDDDDSNED